MKKNYTILAIDTSLDDTCAAVTVDDHVVSNIVSSQVEFHEKFGGTVPHLARRLHQKFLTPTIKRALAKAGLKVSNLSGNIDALAVTYGPGLAPCLEQGIKKAKQLSLKLNKPLLAVNHMEGHLLSAFAKNSKGNGPFSHSKPQYPALGFPISGGHTQLVLMEKLGKYHLLGETLDDAAGEAYDKVARMLKLGYPGGPILSQLAKTGTPKYQLPIPMQQRTDLNFSFSGLKTAALYRLQKLKPQLTRRFTADFAASFQKAAIRSLTLKLALAISRYQPRMLLLGGGVISNTQLRRQIRKVSRRFHLPVFIPYHRKLFTDNAAMIGVCAWYQAQRGEFVTKIDQLDRQPNLNFQLLKGL